MCELLAMNRLWRRFRFNLSTVIDKTIHFLCALFGSWLTSSGSSQPAPNYGYPAAPVVGEMFVLQPLNRAGHKRLQF